MNSIAKHQIMKHLLHKGDKNLLAAIATSRESASKLEKMSDANPLVVRIKLNSPICGATICMTAPTQPSAQSLKKGKRHDSG